MLEMSARPAEHGTLGLASVLAELRIENRLNVGEPTVDPDDDEDRNPADFEEPPTASADPWTEPLRQWVVRLTFQRLADERLTANERRLLSWIAYHLAMSDHPDVAFLARRFLATDVRLSESEGREALEGLIERGLVREVLALSDESRIALQLIVEGMNEPRHEPPTH